MSKSKKFSQFFTGYQETLHAANLIDYDDMLISSVKLLEENPDILAHYQDICHFVIEDEAQDSSAIQQRLIGLLSAKHKNLIRCGDINQAITTTFSNADVEGFRKFIASSNNVSMNCSQRCTKDVWSLANNLVVYAEQHSGNEKRFSKYSCSRSKAAIRNLQTPLLLKSSITRLKKKTLFYLQLKIF